MRPLSDRKPLSIAGRLKLAECPMWKGLSSRESFQPEGAIKRTGSVCPSLSLLSNAPQRI
jgi:hypothetical protein